ncbi:MAG TPA: chemotaxis protein CheW [Holophaga sp.]|nr:chemotaxis protein CheW [Holophaga sp.]
MTPSVADSVRGADVRGASGDHVTEATRQYLTFTLDKHTYAIPLTQVAEITNNLELNHMPHMPKGVEGLLHLRGEVLPIINMRVRMGLPLLEKDLFENILLLDTDGSRTGILVDQVESVITVSQDQITPASPMLSGADGAWTRGFVLLQDRVVVVLDTRRVTALGGSKVHAARTGQTDLARRLDEDLKKLIELAPRRVESSSAQLIPQMEAAISHTEEEMDKVVERIEMMLASADQAFQGLARLKQEAKLGRIPGQEPAIAEIERIGSQIQDQLFELLQLVQFQDIARQKLERVLNHVRGLQMIVGQKFRDIRRA